MVATLCSYENWLGPRHPQTLCLMVAVAAEYRSRGELLAARLLLERAIRDGERYLGRMHDARLRAIVILRDLFLYQCEYGRAGCLQRELLDCQTLRLGADHPDTLTAQEYLATILLSSGEQIPHGRSKWQ